MKKSEILEDIRTLIRKGDLCVVPHSKVAKSEMAYTVALELLLKNGLYQKYQKKLEKLQNK